MLHRAFETRQITQLLIGGRVDGEDGTEFAQRRFDHQVLEKTEILHHPAILIQPDAVLDTVRGALGQKFADIVI